MYLTKLFADEEAQVPVDVSYDIIRHVSAQLYTSPRKAIEEVVCNSYDAGGSECHEAAGHCDPPASCEVKRTGAPAQK